MLEPALAAPEFSDDQTAAWDAIAARLTAHRLRENIIRQFGTIHP